MADENEEELRGMQALWTPLVMAIVAGVFTFFTMVVSENHADRWPTLILLVSVSSCAPFSVALYWLRRMRRAIYGFCELCFGGAAVVSGFFITIGYDGFAKESEFVAGCMAVMTAVFVIVRGLDSLGEGKSQVGWVNRNWDRWFPTPKK